VRLHAIVPGEHPAYVAHPHPQRRVGIARTLLAPDRVDQQILACRLSGVK